VVSIYNFVACADGRKTKKLEPAGKKLKGIAT